jgi:hypothetical protein
LDIKIIIKSIDESELKLLKNDSFFEIYSFDAESLAFDDSNAFFPGQ